MNQLKKEGKLNLKGSTVTELVNDLFRVSSNSDSELSIDNSYVQDGGSTPCPDERHDVEA